LTASTPSIALACPRCRHALEHSGEVVKCSGCGASYPLVESVPVLLGSDLSDQHRHQRGYFDAEFSRYAEYRLENWRMSFIERIFGAVGVLDGEEPYLDVGVGGSGATIIEAARRGVEAVGCDLSVPGVVSAHRFAVEQGVESLARFVVCTAENLPFSDAIFGSASAVAVLEHLDEDGLAVAELSRVLRPGGRVWLTVPHAFRYIPPPVWPLYWWHDRRIGHKRHYDEERLVRVCAEVGLDHVCTTYSAHPVKIIQFAGAKLLPRMRDPCSSAWWRLERRDHRAERRRWGAMHLNAVFQRAA
jgi:SAM-dependent methyltransferase